MEKETPRLWQVPSHAGVVRCDRETRPCGDVVQPGVGGRARSLYATPPCPPPPPPRVLKDSGAGSATNKCP